MNGDVIIHTFKVQNSDELSRPWFSFLYRQGRRLPVNFEGSTEEAVIASARDFWERERRLHKRQTGRECKVFARLPSEPPISKEIEPESYKLAHPPGPISRNEGDGEEKVIEAPIKIGRGQGLTNTVWMINADDTARERVPADQVEKLLGEGWRRGGPRTPLRPKTEVSAAV